MVKQHTANSCLFKHKLCDQKWLKILTSVKLFLIIMISEYGKLREGLPTFELGSFVIVKFILDSLHTSTARIPVYPAGGCCYQNPAKTCK